MTESATDIRAQMRAARLDLSPAERIAAAETLADHLEQLPEFLVDDHVAGYWAVNGELSLHAAYARLRSRQQTYHLPILDSRCGLRFAAWEPGKALQTNRYGIPEPEVTAADCLRPDALDLVLVPLLGFDRRGHRIGHGAGYYDRSFAFLRDRNEPGKPVLVGIGYHFQEVAQLHPHSWDVRMDFIATDRELIACSGGAG